MVDMITIRITIMMTLSSQIMHIFYIDVKEGHQTSSDSDSGLVVLTNKTLQPGSTELPGGGAAVLTGSSPDGSDKLVDGGDKCPDCIRYHTIGPGEQVMDVPVDIVPFSGFYRKPTAESPACISRKHFEFLRDHGKLTSMAQSPKTVFYFRVVFKGGSQVSLITRQPDWVDWLIHYTLLLRTKKYKFHRSVLFHPGLSIAGPIFGPNYIQECGALPTINSGSNACKQQ